MGGAEVGVLMSRAVRYLYICLVLFGEGFVLV